MLILFVLL